MTKHLIAVREDALDALRRDIADLRAMLEPREEWVTVGEAAKRLGRSKFTVWRLVRQKTLRTNGHKGGLFRVCGNQISTMIEVAEEERRFKENHGGTRPPVSVRKAVLERDGERCTYCGDTGGPFHVDHILPRLKGGGNEMENLTVACQSCNLSKKDKTLSEWGIVPVFALPDDDQQALHT